MPRRRGRACLWVVFALSFVLSGCSSDGILPPGGHDDSETPGLGDVTDNDPTLTGGGDAKGEGGQSARIIVKFRKSAPAGQRAALHKKNGFDLERVINQLDVHAVRIPKGRTADEVIAKYQSHPLVEFVEVEPLMRPETIPNDPWFANQQYLRTRPCSQFIGCWDGMDAERAWDLTTGSAVISIGVLDTGLDYYHYEFAARFQRGEIYGWDFLDDDPDFYDTGGHGTAVGGVIGAEANNGLGITGVNWDNPMVVMRNGFGLSAVEGIQWAADNGIRVLNMSFGAGIDSSVIRDACQYAYDRGVVLVGAAGNAGVSTPTYPAAYPTVLAVTGVEAVIDGSGQVVWEPTGFNWGDWIDLSAGDGALSTFRAGTGNIEGNSLGYIGGTSIAAPFVAAAAGLVLSANPDLSAQCVMDILRSSADDIGDPGFDVYTGWGRVNFYRAVLAAQTWDCGGAPDTTPPVVQIVAPTAGSVLSGLATVAADAQDDTRVTQVNLYRDGLFVGSDTVAPHEWTVNTIDLPNGPHTFSAVAFDANGNSAQSEAVQVTVDNGSPCDAVEQPGVTCADGSDNDCDGLFDCADTDCAGDPTCADGPNSSCNNDGACQSGEDCETCPGDCHAGNGATCGNGVCEAGNGEDCLSCPRDCAGKQSGNPDLRYCCGTGGGDHPVGCGDQRCNSDGSICTTAAVVDSCCGDGVCSGPESGCSCPIDCGAAEGREVAGSTCRDALDNDCDGLADCGDPDCAGDLQCPKCDNDGVCEAGENCRSCKSDCAGKSAGNSGNSFCCGDEQLAPAEGDGSICHGNP